MIPLNRLCNLGVVIERSPKKVNTMMFLDAQTRCMQHRIPGLSGQRFAYAMNDISLLMSVV